jgi:hypothetical protein
MLPCPDFKVTVFGTEQQKEKYFNIYCTVSDLNWVSEFRIRTLDGQHGPQQNILNIKKFYVLKS